MGEALSGGEPGSPECLAGENSEVKNMSQLSGLPQTFIDQTNQYYGSSL